MTEASALTDFELPATGNQRFRLSAFRGHPVVLYFYPKDSTPGCITEGGNFRDLHPQFQASKVAVFGVSRDSIASPRNPGRSRVLPGIHFPPPRPTRCPTIP